MKSILESTHDDLEQLYNELWENTARKMQKETTWTISYEQVKSRLTYLLDDKKTNSEGQVP